jgi:DNA mismatch repair protein MutH
MHRDEAVRKLKELEGQDLHALAKKYEVTVLSSSGKVNKGWAGHVCERFLGLPINSSRSPNFGSWELKSVPLKRLKNGLLTFKETMAITMIDEYNVKRTSFEESHLLAKLKKAVIVARTVGASYDMPTVVHSVTAIDLSGELYEAVRADYEIVRECLNDPERGFSALTGKMGTFIQPRTKGAGHGSISRAFYARPRFLARFIDLNE